MVTAVDTALLYNQDSRINDLSNDVRSLISKLQTDLTALTARVEALEAKPAATDYSSKLSES